jgi:hypothetical protein
MTALCSVKFGKSIRLSRMVTLSLWRTLRRFGVVVPFDPFQGLFEIRVAQDERGEMPDDMKLVKRWIAGYVVPQKALSPMRKYDGPPIRTL